MARISVLFLSTCLLLAARASSSSSSSSPRDPPPPSSQAAKPNILLIVSDDLGYGDLGCYGRRNISTPNIDRLAHEGIKFTQWISAAPICTPSRAGLLTGRLPRRFGMTADALPWRVLITLDQPGGLPYEEHTMAELLRPAGYATAMSGKWHLGISNKTIPWAHLPMEHGFDSYVGIPYTNSHQCAAGHEDKTFCILMANHTVVEQPTVYSNLTYVLADHAVSFITRQARAEQPFLFFLSFMHVHTPLFTSARFTNVSRGGRFGDNAEEMDWAVGEVLQALDDLGIANNTLVFFISDNGPFAEEGWDNSGRTAGLKGSKGQTYEGGIRVPGLARWPGVAPAGVTTDTLVSSLDIFPTVLAAAGVPLPDDRIIDGKDLTAVLRNPTSAASPHEFMWHYCGHNVTAARHGKYKLHFATANWSSTFQPSPDCIQCCPYGATSFNGTGGSLCDCDAKSLIFHNPPLIFDMSVDPLEDHPLTPLTMPTFFQEIAAVRAALKQHYDGMSPAPDQMHTLPDPHLMPCCNGVWPLASCECNTYEPGIVYP